MKKDKRQRLTSSSQAKSSPDDFDRRFSALYKSGVDKMSLSDLDKRNLSVKLHQAGADSPSSNQAKPLWSRKPLLSWVSSAAAIVLVIGGLYLAGLNLGQVGDKTATGRPADEGLVGDFSVENDNSSDQEDGMEREDEGGTVESGAEAGPVTNYTEDHGLQPQEEMSQDSYSYFSRGGVSDPHSFYYAVYGDESKIRIQLQMSRLILPNPIFTDNGEVRPLPEEIAPDMPEGLSDEERERYLASLAAEENAVNDENPAVEENPADGGDTAVDGNLTDGNQSSGGGIDGNSGSASDLPMDLPVANQGDIDPAAPVESAEAGAGNPSSLYLLDLVILEIEEQDSWAAVADSQGQEEFKLSTQFDEMAADLYKALGDGYIVVPTPSELNLYFDMGLTEGGNYRLVLETTDETIYLPFTYKSIN